MGISQQRLGSTIQRELAHIVNNVIKNGRVGNISITEAKVTKDLSFCYVYYTILSEEQEIIELTNTLLENNNKEIRMKLAEKIRNVRKIPELIFKYDEALAYGNRIETLLKEIKK